MVYSMPAAAAVGTMSDIRARRRRPGADGADDSSVVSSPTLYRSSLPSSRGYDLRREPGTRPLAAHGLMSTGGAFARRSGEASGCLWLDAEERRSISLSIRSLICQVEYCLHGEGRC